jgi:signal transduction histidine kinase
MLKPFRTVRISLAAKCQLLFGAAVVLIISAALFVPWQRMEQLMAQMNQRAGSAVADRAVMDHILYESTRLGLEPVSVIPAPTTSVVPATLPGQESLSDGKSPGAESAAADLEDAPPRAAFPPPRLVALAARKDRQHTTRFERDALDLFQDKLELDFVGRRYTRHDGTDGYKFARPLYLTAECVSCHAAAGPVRARSRKRAGLNSLTTQPTTQPAAQATRRAQDATLIGLVSVDIPSQIEASQLLLNRTFILTAGLLAGTLAIIVFYLITTKLILQPVRVLQETAEKVSLGDLNIRSDISTGDEFQQLSETFNTMLANLKEGEDQLRAINKGLDLKLGELAESNVALYESNRLKSEFLANVSHELRTPLNSILGFADLLKEAAGAPADGKVNRYIQNILTSGKNLLALITDLLDLAKIEAGRMEVRSEPLSVNDLFEGLTSILKPLTEAKGLRVDDQVAADVPIMHTDPAKLQQILYNFLSNAIKFSPQGSAIDLRAQRQGDQSVRISVSDTGPGIAPEKQKAIFEKFRQLDGSVTREHGGTGLGLAISRELALLLGGKVGVESVPGEGATFWVVLPLRIQPGTQDVREKLVLS